MASSDDRSVLLEIFWASNGPSWLRKGGWNTTTSISSWHGVTVDGNGRVVKLDLSKNNLQGTIPESLGRLSKLTGLFLHNNQLTGAIPESLGQLSNLVSLFLYNNQLSGVIPESLGKMSSLMGLFLHNNQLSGAIPESLGQLFNVALIYLHNNQLSGSIPMSLGQLSNLTHIFLDINQLSGPIPDSFGNLAKLTALHAHRNQLSGAIPETLGKLSKLMGLFLHNNQLSGVIPESLGQLPNLTELHLHINKLSGAIPESLGQLSNLTELDTHTNQLSGTIPESLGQLSNLIELHVHTNQLSGTIPDSLGQLSSLMSLLLHNNQLSGTLPEALGDLPNLMTLYLHNNRFSGISEESARRLQRFRTSIITLEKNPWGSPPAEVVNGGLEKIIGYWEAIARSGAIVSWKLKVVLVGAVKAGKTSLVKGMVCGKPQLCHEEDRTKGVDVHVDEPCKSDAAGELELVFWDFAGHSEYYATHQVFLSKGALHLLVVDLKRFCDESSARGELVDVWLDALQCRVPGSSVLVIATQIDRLTGDLEAGLGDLRHTVETHHSAKRDELQRVRPNSSMSSDVPQGLVFHGVESVSAAHVESLLDLRLKLSTLVYTKRGLFPSVGRMLPVSWGRVSAMLNAKRSGKDPILEASRVGPVKREHRKLETMSVGTGTSGPSQKFLHRADATCEWRRVVRTLRLEKEVGSTIWDITVRKFKRNGNERKGKAAVFEDALGQLTREGTILDSGEVLYLEPTWINHLLRAILDHDLADDRKEKFWKDELETFSGKNNEVYWNLKKIHDNFPSTGILTVGYLRFLWRDIPEISDKTLFELLDTMSRFGVVFRVNPSGAAPEHMETGLDDSAKLFVPLHLPPNILESDLEEFAALLKSQFHKELVYEIRQTYVPPGVLGMLMARFLLCEGVEFRKCWSRGAAFTIGEVLVLLQLNTPSHGEDEARITANLFGVKFVTDLSKAVDKIEREIKSTFVERFGELAIGRKPGYPRDVDGINLVYDRNTADSLSTVDVVNAVVAKIDGLEEHLDRELSRLLQGLHQLEGNLQVVAKSCFAILARVNKLQPEEVPCPNLLIVRPAAAMASDKQKRSLYAMLEDLGRRAKKFGCKDMRLCFLCPYDFSEVPCGLDGNGYPFTASREWVTKIRPALKVTAVLAKVAIKAASGLDLPVFDFLNGAKSYLGEELADRMLDDGAVEETLYGSAVGEGEVKRVVGEADEELKTFMVAHECVDKGRCIHFDKCMQLVDDGDGRKVWVRNENVQLWKDARS